MTVGIVAHSSWVINNSKYMRGRMTKMEAAALRPGKGGQQTYDFSTMYTSVKLECVEEKMNQYVDLTVESLSTRSKVEAERIVARRKCCR